MMLIGERKELGRAIVSLTWRAYQWRRRGLWRAMLRDALADAGCLWGERFAWEVSGDAAKADRRALARIIAQDTRRWAESGDWPDDYFGGNTG